MSESEAPAYIDIVFDGPPGPESGRFVEVEDANRRSIKYGKWIQRNDYWWVLRIPDAQVLQARVAELEADTNE